MTAGSGAIPRPAPCATRRTRSALADAVDLPPGAWLPVQACPGLADVGKRVLEQAGAVRGEDHRAPAVRRVPGPAGVPCCRERGPGLLRGRGRAAAAAPDAACVGAVRSVQQAGVLGELRVRVVLYAGVRPVVPRAPDRGVRRVGGG